MKRGGLIKRLSLVLILILSFAGIWGCGRGSGAGVVVTSDAPFFVVSISPLNGAVDVGLRTDVEVYFSEAVDEETVTPETFSITSVRGTVEGTIDSSGAKATYSPSDLSENTTYTITLTGIRSVPGSALDRSSYTSEFTTGTNTDSGRGTGGINAGGGGEGCGDGTCADDETVTSCVADCLAGPEDYFWVAGNGGDHAGLVEKSGNLVANITTGSNPVAIAADDTHVWVANGDDGTVTRISKTDLTTTSITATSADRTLSAIAVDDTHVWVVNLEPEGTMHPQGEGRDDYVTRITKSNLSETTDIAVGDNPMDVAVDETYVWVLLMIDPMATGSITRITRADTSVQTNISSVGTVPDAIAVDDDYVWFVNSGPSTSLARLDKASVRTECEVGELVCVLGVVASRSISPIPSGIAVDETSVWVVNLTSDTVTRFTMPGMSEQETIKVGDSPRGISLDDTYVWVVNSGDGTVTRITKSDSTTTTISVGGNPISKGDATGYYYERFFSSP